MPASHESLVQQADSGWWPPLTQGNKATQRLAASQDVGGVHEEGLLQGRVPLLLVHAVHVPGTGGVLQVLQSGGIAMVREFGAQTLGAWWGCVVWSAPSAMLPRLSAGPHNNRA